MEVFIDTSITVIVDAIAAQPVLPVPDCQRDNIVTLLIAGKRAALLTRAQANAACGPFIGKLRVVARLVDKAVAVVIQVIAGDFIRFIGVGVGALKPSRAEAQGHKALAFPCTGTVEWRREILAAASITIIIDAVARFLTDIQRAWLLTPSTICRR